MPRKKTARRRGSIREVAPGKFRVRLCVGKNADGTYSYHDETVLGDWNAANAVLSRVTQERYAGSYTVRSKRTLGEWFNEWLKIHRTKVMPRTADWYAYNFDHYARAALGSVKLTDLTAAQIESFIATLHGKYSAVTIRGIYLSIHVPLRHAAKRRVIAFDPSAEIELPKVERTERRVFTPDEARKFIAACGEVPRGLIVEFALLTGMRPEEYLALRWSDYDARRGAVTVQRVLVMHKGETSFEKPKTAKARRAIPLPQSLCAKLAAHRKEQLQIKLKAGRAWVNNDLIFCTRTGTPLRRGNVTEQVYEKVLDRAGLPRIRLYDLRHSQATIMLIMNEHPKVVSERLGHSSVQITMDTYSHVLSGMQERATERLEELLYADSR
jgi:integrase